MGRLAVLAALCLVGCTPTASPSAQPAAAGTAATQVSGRAGAFELVARDAIYRRSTRQGLDFMIVALTDLDDACAALLEGTLELSLSEPRLHLPNGSVLAWEVFRTGSGAHISPGSLEIAIPPFEGRSPRPPTGEATFGFPVLATSDGACANHHVTVDLDSPGTALRLLEVPAEGPVTGEFTVAVGSDRLTGRFSARRCEFPPGTARPPPARCAPRSRTARSPRSPAELAELAELVPLGAPMGRAGGCWRAQLACRPTRTSERARERLEVSYLASLHGRPTVGRPFPPPPLPHADEAMPIYSILRMVPDGSRGAAVDAIDHVRRAGEDLVVYRADRGSLSFEVSRSAAEDGWHRARLVPSVDPPVDYQCRVPPTTGPEAERWRYESFAGDCPRR